MKFFHRAVRILQFNTYADPIGGAEVYAMTLTRELRSRGHVVGFFGTSPNREVDEEALRVVRRPLYDPHVLWSEPAVATALQAFARRFQPDLIHVHNVFSLGLDVLEALGALGLPGVQTVHDFNRVCPNSWCVRGDGTVCEGGIGAQCFRNQCQKNYPFDAQVALHALLRHRALLDLIDVSICPSRNLAERLESHGQRGVVHVPNAIEPIPSSPEHVRKPKELLYVGRLTPEKGVDTLLEALPLLRKQDPEVHLTVVAGGSPPATLTDRIRGIAGVSLFTDVPRDELGRFYATATACVIPSIWCENAPLVAFECLAAGLPMVASRIGGIPELVLEGVTGFTFLPRDPRDLAEKARHCLGLSREERERISAAARERAARFRLDAHVTRIEEIYREVGGIRRGPRIPTTAMDADLRALLLEQAQEKARAEGSWVPVSRLRRVARALNLPKVFPR